MKPKSPKQLTLLPGKKDSTRHGGEFRKGKRKLARPFHAKLPMHVVVRASRAQGVFSMLHPKHEKKIKELVRSIAKKNFVQIHHYVNVGNHLHLLTQAATKERFNRFLRSLTGRIAVLVTGAIKGKPKGKFWDQLAYSRLVSWGRDLQGILSYFIKNELQAVGLGDLVASGRKKSTPRPLTL